jgi:hypothetical protein
VPRLTPTLTSAPNDGGVGDAPNGSAFGNERQPVTTAETRHAQALGQQADLLNRARLALGFLLRGRERQLC